MTTTYANAYGARETVYSLVTERTHMSPWLVGVIEVEDGSGYGLKVGLPRRPNEPLPTEVNGVPIRYVVAVDPPSLVSAPASSEWRRRMEAAAARHNKS